MTFCLGCSVQEGLVGLADTLITSGNECISARKVSVFERDGLAMFLMTSGLRSVRDKSIIYFEDLLEQRDKPYDRLYKAVNDFAKQIRRVADEDGKALQESGLQFNIHALLGGQASGDKEHKLYMMYPQGNWVEIGEGSPYQIIGATAYGKPVMDRTLKYEDSLKLALKVGCLAFDSTRISASDVDFPLDVLLYRKDSYRFIQRRYEHEDLAEMTSWWQDRLRQSVADLPVNWLSGILDEFGDTP